MDDGAALHHRGRLEPSPVVQRFGSQKKRLPAREPSFVPVRERQHEGEGSVGNVRVDLLTHPVDVIRQPHRRHRGAPQRLPRVRQQRILQRLELLLWEIIRRGGPELGVLPGDVPVVPHEPVLVHSSRVVVVRIEHAAKGDGVGGGEKGVDDADVLGPLGDLDLRDFLLVVALARRRRRRRAVLLRGGEASSRGRLSRASGGGSGGDRAREAVDAAWRGSRERAREDGRRGRARGHQGGCHHCRGLATPRERGAGVAPVPPLARTRRWAQ